MQQKQRQLWDRAPTQPSQNMLKQLYKQQLDDIMQKKTRDRETERQKNFEERKKLNELMEYEKQISFKKQQAYKNYYKLLINEQEVHNQSYVSPYYKRDKLKDQHITKMIEDGQKQLKAWQKNKKNREEQLKKNYIAGIKSQLEQKRQLKIKQRERQKEENQFYRKNGLLPGEISRIERLKHRQEMQKYKQDLDEYSGPRSYVQKIHTEEQDTSYLKHHDPLLNPLPFHIQNPYILKQMHMQKKKQEERSKIYFP